MGTISVRVVLWNKCPPPTPPHRTRPPRSVSICLSYDMGVAACLQWETHSTMTMLTTTHRHDFRWPGKECLMPKAAVPNGECEGRSGDYRPGRVDTTWCGIDAPQPPAPPYRDLLPTPVDKPWFQRGLVVPQIKPPPPTAPATVRTQPPGCDCEPSALAVHTQPPGCKVSAPARPQCDHGAQPRAVAARMGAAPQQDASRYDQPNQYLSKLCDKYPRPTAVIAASPRDELVRRVYTDRYRTTYQSDYCRSADDTARLLGKCGTHDVNKQHKYNKYDNHNPGYQPLTEGVGLSHTSCKCGCGSGQTHQSAGDQGVLRPPACRPAAVSHHVHFSCCSPKKPLGSFSSGEEVGPPKKLPPWITEYTDNIGRTGQIIMDQKLHHPSKEKKLQ